MRQELDDCPHLLLSDEGNGLDAYQRPGRVISALLVSKNKSFSAESITRI